MKIVLLLKSTAMKVLFLYNTAIPLTTMHFTRKPIQGKKLFHVHGDFRQKCTIFHSGDMKFCMKFRECTNKRCKCLSSASSFDILFCAISFQHSIHNESNYNQNNICEPKPSQRSSVGRASCLVTCCEAVVGLLLDSSPSNACTQIQG